MTIAEPTHLKFWARRKLPLILQSEKGECGLACLCMIARYWGHGVDVSSLRRRFSVSQKGATLRNLIGIAKELSLQSRAVRVEMEDLNKLMLPAILHWDLNHFVVLKSVATSSVTIHDPNSGVKRLSIAEVSKHFSGVALELQANAEFRKIEDTQEFSLFSLMGHVVGLKRGLGKILALGFVLQLFALAAPFYTQWLIDDALLTADHNLVTVLGLGFAALLLIQNFVSAVRSWMGTVLSTRLNLQWLTNAFAHLLRLPLAYFEKRHTGDVVSRFNSIQTIQENITTQFVEGIIDGILVFATFAMMLLYSVQLTMVASVAILLYLAVRLAFYEVTRSALSEQITHTAKQKTHFLESVRGVQSIRLFNRADQRRQSWANSLVDQFNAELKGKKLFLSYETIGSIIFGLEKIAVLWIGVLAVMNNNLSVGMLFAFISYKDQFLERLRSLVGKVIDWRMLRIHGERVADIVLSQPEEALDGTGFAPDIPPTIELRNVSFRYADNEPHLFENLNLTIPSGEFLAITGTSGCGKTTLIKLMVGLLMPTAGEILVGGKNIRHIGMQAYRDQVGAVMQEDTLFSGSIADNISFFAEDPQLSRVVKSAQIAAIHDEIESLPMGYNTLVGDLGSGLSGGQKQRILLARALFADPMILVLDEATSHLDVRNEELVSNAIKQDQRTRVTVAHRPETIRMADRIVVLERGVIVSDSSHGHTKLVSGSRHN